MTQRIPESVGPGDQATDALGTSFVHALAIQDFDALEHLFIPEPRFRAMVPSGERVGQTAQEAAGWLRRWFGSCDTLQVLQSNAGPVFDRLYLYYRVRLHDAKDGWRVIEQHAYCQVQEGKIADLWMVCSGFRPDLYYSEASEGGALQSPEASLGGDVYYDAGSKGCAEGPLDEIARLMRGLGAGQSLEIHATDPGVAKDLPAWCRLSGHSLEKQVEDHYLIRHL
jgi:TusA-related sulfurtransferase